MSKKLKYIEVEGLGAILVRTNSRARRFIFRVKDNQLVMTSPEYSTTQEQIRAAEQMSEKLKLLLHKSKVPLIDLDFKIDAPLFVFKIQAGQGARFTVKSELGALEVLAPSSTNYTDPELQNWLQRVILEAIRRNAKAVLPTKLSQLAQRHGIAYQTVRINTSRGRWGSCSGKGSINLSAYLMLLPEHLIDYVLLHELTHIEHMDHSPKFWNRLDQLTDYRAQQLNQELKRYNTSIFQS